MKKNDIALIVLIVSITSVASYFGIKPLVGEPKDNIVTAEVVEPISSQLVKPSAAIFNKGSINPTVNIEIGKSENQQPFSGN